MNRKAYDIQCVLSAFKKLISEHSGFSSSLKKKITFYQNPSKLFQRCEKLSYLQRPTKKRYYSYPFHLLMPVKYFGELI